MPDTMPNDANTAVRLGREAGLIPERRASDCPHQHSALSLRTTWMDGFSRERAEMQVATVTGPATHV